MKEAVVALGFGAPAGLDSNKNIGWSATKMANRIGVPVFTQLGPAMWIQKVQTVPMPGEYLGHYPSTMQVATAAVAWAKENGVVKLWIAAATPHMWRALREFHMAASAAGVEIDIVPCPEADPLDYLDWFCDESEQWWTQSPITWLLREIPLRLIMTCLPTSLYMKLTNKPF